MIEKTLSIIKPDAMSKKLAGVIIKRLEDEGFKIIGMKYLHLKKEQAMEFYAEHKEKPFYLSLVNFITETPVIVLALEKENAVSDLRKLMGSTDPKKAELNTLRSLYGLNIERNAIHGSADLLSAERELSFFFAKYELT